MHSISTRSLHEQIDRTLVLSLADAPGVQLGKWKVHHERWTMSVVSRAKRRKTRSSSSIPIPAKTTHGIFAPTALVNTPGMFVLDLF
jgi:hypothetical protein